MTQGFAVGGVIGSCYRTVRFALACPTLNLLHRFAVCVYPKFSCFNQQFQALTTNKPAGQQWVSKAQYIRYFALCANLVDPDNDATQDADLEALLEVGAAPVHGFIPYIAFRISLAMGRLWLEGMMLPRGGDNKCFRPPRDLLALKSPWEGSDMASTAAVLETRHRRWQGIVP